MLAVSHGPKLISRQPSGEMLFPLSPRNAQECPGMPASILPRQTSRSGKRRRGYSVGWDPRSTPPNRTEAHLIDPSRTVGFDKDNDVNASVPRNWKPCEDSPRHTCYGLSLQKLCFDSSKKLQEQLRKIIRTMVFYPSATEIR